MAFLRSKKTQLSIVLIDIDSSSVGGALVHIESGSVPIIYYSVREFIEIKEHEEASEAMLRTLEEISSLLTTKGAPVLRQETGSGHVDQVFVSVGAPWQKTKVRIESISETKPFVFTQALLSEVVKKDKEVPEGYVKSGESVISTLLNGYEMPKPFGKKVTRAEMLILSSLLDKKVTEAVEKSLRKTYHTHALTLTAFAPVAYSVFRNIYPHERDFLVLEVSGEATDIAFIKHGLLVDVVTISHGVNDLVRGASETRNTDEVEKEWLANIQAALQETAVRHALPHTLFL